MYQLCVMINESVLHFIKKYILDLHYSGKLIVVIKLVIYYIIYIFEYILELAVFPTVSAAMQ